MRKLAVLAPAAAALALAASAAASSPVVPVFTQHQIAKRAPAVAYVPARLVPFWHYRNWKASGGVLRIWFTNPARQTIVFSAARLHGSCRAGMEKGFQMAGVKVWWSHTATHQQAWRCVHDVRIAATTKLPPTRFADVGLGRIAASGHRIR